MKDNIKRAHQGYTCINCLATRMCTSVAEAHDCGASHKRIAKKLSMTRGTRNDSSTRGYAVQVRYNFNKKH